MGDMEGAGIGEGQAPDRYSPHGAGEVWHQRDPDDEAGALLCCGLAPLQVPLWHRLTLRPELVTCKGKDGGDG